MRKTYIFVTMNIFSTGGVQPYVASKVDYLSNIGWNVKVMYPDIMKRKTLYRQLQNYEDGMFPELMSPTCFYSRGKVHDTLDRMIRYLGDLSDSDEIVVESHDDHLSPWAEILAQRLGAKHITVLLNEDYRGKNKYYEHEINFYDFKFRRGEVGGSYFTLVKLFAGYRTITQKDATPFWLDEDPIADVENDRIDAIEKYDYNICHIGRVIKDYVPATMNGIRRFADAHSDKRIQLIFIGNIDGRREEIARIFSGSTNVTLLELGDLVPIPRTVFGKCDIVIASSGSARHSAHEKKPVVVMATNGLSNGLLGYETKESVKPAGEQWPLEEVLERSLIDRCWEAMMFDYPKLSVAKCCEQNYEFIRSSSQVKEYYPEDKLLKRPVHVGIDRLFKCWLYVYFPKLTQKLVEIKNKHLKP